MVGIISNSAALFAQRNLETASRSSELSIARLSSGNRIIRASDDVAGLAVGTVLATTVSTLRTVLGSTAQANSLLAIADGGLKNIGDILQRQKSLAVQANTGSLSDNERAFLQQEFSNLTSEINRISENTEFNGIKLLNGTIGGIAGVTTATGNATETYSINTTADYTVDDAPSSGAISAVTVAGEITTAASQTVHTIDFSGSNGADTFNITIEDSGDANGETTATITAAADDAATARLAVQALNTAKAAAAAGDVIQDYVFEAEGSRVVIRVKDGVTTDHSADHFTVTEVVAAASGTSVSFNGAAALDIDSGSIADVDEATGTPLSTYAAEVSVAAGNTVFDYDLQGAITNISAQFIAGADNGSAGYDANQVQLTLLVGGNTYTSDAVSLHDGVTFDGSNYTLTGSVLESGTVLTFRNLALDSTDVNDVQSLRLTVGQDYTIGTQDNADTAAAAFQAGIDASATTIYQSRELSSVSDTAVVGTVLDGLTSTDVLLQGSNFSTTGTLGSVGNFSVDRSAGTISVTIDDVLYTADLTVAGGLDSNQFTLGGTTINTTNNLILSSTDSTTDAKSLTIDLSQVSGGSSSIAFAGTADATALESALNLLVQVGDSGSLVFQVGTKATDSIGVSISSAQTTDLYKDANGAVVALDISTAGVLDSSNGGDGTGAILASNVLDRAINTVTALRATVGALQSRFDFAAANVTSSIQNTEAARSNFLDVDIADESTKFATAQVRLQASISVLAQANQIPQNLLKLIG